MLKVLVSLVTCSACNARPARRYGVCGGCLPELGQPVAYPGVVTLGSYDGKLKSMVGALKYRGAVRAAEFLGDALAARVRSRGWPLLAVTSVPSHPLRVRERGYDQAELLARRCALGLGVPWLRLLAREAGSLQQSRLPTHRRRGNAGRLFGLHAGAPRVLPRRLLLVDDVLTTGASLEACRELLLLAGAETVWFAAAAAARPRRRYGREEKGLRTEGRT